MLQQLDPAVRNRHRRMILGDDHTLPFDLPPQQACISLGMDQGLHNYLLHSGTLDRYMTVKMFPQGEGPVNTIGAFVDGKNALLHFNLSEWGILNGKTKERTINNWNGELSPAVHQYDRFG